MAPYEKTVIELRSKGYIYSEIHKIISQKVYEGSVASLRAFIQKERTREYSTTNGFKYVRRTSLCRLVYTEIENIYAISLEEKDAALREYPILSKLYGIVREFYTVFYGINPERLEEWISKASKLMISELNTFIEGNRRDKAAVRNAIEQEFNNGLAEGSVNKIKVAKRIMYG